MRHISNSLHHQLSEMSFNGIYIVLGFAVIKEDFRGDSGSCNTIALVRLGPAAT